MRLEPVAWLVVGEREYRAAFIDQTIAIVRATEHRGVIVPLVREDAAHEALMSVRETLLANRSAAKS